MKLLHSCVGYSNSANERVWWVVIFKNAASAVFNICRQFVTYPDDLGHEVLGLMPPSLEA